MSIETGHLDRLTEGERRPGDLPLVCMQCGYNLTGVPSPRCPECGTAIVRREIEKYVRDMKWRVKELEDMNGWIRLAFWAAIFAVVGAGLGVLLGSYAGGTLRVLAVLAGGIAACLGLAAFRVQTLPPWTRDYMNATPDYVRGVAATAIGVIAVVVGVYNW